MSTNSAGAFALVLLRAVGRAAREGDPSQSGASGKAAGAALPCARGNGCSSNDLRPPRMAHHDSVDPYAERSAARSGVAIDTALYFATAGKNRRRSALSIDAGEARLLPLRFLLTTAQPGVTTDARRASMRQPETNFDGGTYERGINEARRRTQVRLIY
jgi:hypothetical protein